MKGVIYRDLVINRVSLIFFSVSLNISFVVKFFEELMMFYVNKAKREWM